MSELYEKLINIQNELVVRKERFNKFGNYNYRNAEDVLNAVKPLCKKYGILLTMSDEIVIIEERIYVKSTAKVFYKDEELSVTGFAREEFSKKGMDASQITGATSSYARKYALNGLFCLDDVKDADSMPPAEVKVDERLLLKKEVVELGKTKNITATELAEKYNLSKDTTVDDFKKILERLKNE